MMQYMKILSNKEYDNMLLEIKALQEQVSGLKMSNKLLVEKNKKLMENELKYISDISKLKNSIKS